MRSLLDEDTEGGFGAHDVARSFMESYEKSHGLSQCSLDEWIYRHNDVLTDADKKAAWAILKLFEGY